jgi:ATP-dependent protease ClpP protease subunit
MLDEKRDPRAAFSAGELQVARDSVQAHGGAGVAFLDGEIGRNVLRGTSAFNFCRRLDALKAAGARAAVVRVTSGGGDIAEGLAMIRALERFSAETGPVVAFVAGLAGSMASAVALSADYVIADPLAGRFFMHEPSGGTDEHRASLRERIVGIYEARTLLDRTMIEGFMAGEVTLDAYSAHSHGLVDEVADIPRVEVVARAAATAGGLWAAPIRAANSWRRHVLRERQAYAEGCARYGRRP